MSDAVLSSIITGLVAIAVQVLILLGNNKKNREDLSKRDEKINDAIKCLLRSDILKAYYGGKGDRTVNQYEMENVELEYSAYKAMGGNSFIDGVYSAMRNWDIEN